MSDYWQALAERRITRRRVLQAGGAGSAALGAIAIVGCGGGSKSPATSNSTSDETPRVGGRLQVAVPAPFDTFDPHLAVGAAVPVFPRTYNVLVNQSSTKPDYFVFDLAESYENPDDTTWLFKIRPGVRVGPNDLGVPERDLDAEDVVATFERIKGEPKATNGAFVKEFVSSVTAEGNVVRIKTNQPYAWLLNRSGNFLNCIVPRELIADGGIDKMKSQSAGGGPYRLISSAEGEGAKLERNPSYYKDDGSSSHLRLPYIDGIDIRFIADRSAWRTAFLSGQIHQYLPESKSEFDEIATGGRTALKEPAFNFIPINMNAQQAPFTDARARRAIARATNRQQYIDIVYGGDAKPDGLVHWPVGEGTYAFTADELEELQPFDLADAKALVEAVGGFEVDFTFPANAPVNQHDRHLPIFIEQMQAAGIKLNQRPQALPAWLASYRARDYVLTLALTQVIETPEFPLNWHQAKGPAGDGTYGMGLGDPEIEAALVKTKTTLDLQARIDAVREAQRVIYRKDPNFLPLVSAYSYSVYSENLRNVPQGLGTTANLLTTMWLAG